MGTATKTYRVGAPERAINQAFRGLTILGLGARHRHVLTVTGRRSGLPRSVPVDVMTVAGEKWLVAPYGEVQWVRNLRVDPHLTLRRGHATRGYVATEVDAATAAPVIRTYIRAVPITRGYWGVRPDVANEELVRVAASHPVFRLTPARPTAQPMA